ncbi:uncharacterized protein LOC132269947 isoform X1 [Cornus florida]|uniref:uncharacterized protein LOC132269947 isoform X1 n=1 Tax=Cornus florida TaxID=4283 RepID=UPI002896F660|nr:uncharacterized protein LOC132269947 isoform X1 [Cornus florida]XP_059627152.1 uncharacterized protein LOC132269947 isoform X1 [Cornus florida]XP_059627153.1 uncharacterized protein LOC132269947 isoform X1 [Cornus florida]
MNSEKEEASITPRRLSCTTCFDALWFCYWLTVGHVGDGDGDLDNSGRGGEIGGWGGVLLLVVNDSLLGVDLESPVHQMQRYYRLGVLDNCSAKWSSLVDCLSLKTKRSSELEEILETREKSKPHIWTFRTPEEAASHWKELFGDSDEVA